jgi:hypothetical protein
MEPYSVQGTVVNDSNKDAEDETLKSVVNGEETAPGSCCDGDEVVEGSTLPTITVTAPRDLGGVLGRAANIWHTSGNAQSTYGNIGFNFNQGRTNNISIFNSGGFYLNGTTPILGANFSLEWIKAYNEQGKLTTDVYLNMALTRGLDVGIGGKVSRYNSIGILRHRDLQGFALQTSVGNYSLSNSISYSGGSLFFNDVTGYSFSSGPSINFPIKTSFSVGIGYSFNLTQMFK